MASHSELLTRRTYHIQCIGPSGDFETFYLETFSGKQIPVILFLNGFFSIWNSFSVMVKENFENFQGEVG